MWRGRVGGVGCCGELSEDGERLPPSLASGSCRAGGLKTRGMKGVSIELVTKGLEFSSPLSGPFGHAGTAPRPAGWGLLPHPLRHLQGTVSAPPI